MLIYDPILGTTTTPSALVQAANVDDFDHAMWVARYGKRRQAYLMAPYTGGDVQFYGLFLARDPMNNVIAFTKRVFAEFKFIVESDVPVVAGPLSLEVTPAVVAAGPSGPEAAAIFQAQGEAVWQRSNLGGWWERCVRDGAICGDVFMEAVRFKRVEQLPGGGSREVTESKIVCYPPECCEAVYDNLGTTLTTLWVRMDIYDPPSIEDIDGNQRDRAARSYRRRVTADRVDVWIDGVRQPDGTEGAGFHFFGVVPAVHAPWKPYSQPEHGLGSGEGVDAALALVDSFASQMLAIGARHANPILVATGVSVAGLDLFKLGRAISVEGEASIDYLEANLQGVTGLLEQARGILDNVRATNPQFALFGAGANASGEALRMLGSKYIAEIEGVRRRVHGALALVTAYARSMDAGETWRPDRAIYRIVAPPVLPVDVAAETERVQAAVERGLMTRVDGIKHLQRLGLIGTEQDPAAYAASIATEQAELDARAMDRLAALRVEGAVISDETDPERIAGDLDALDEELGRDEPDLAAVREELRALRAILGPRGG